MNALAGQNKRIILIHWKDNIQTPFEVFSNLKVLCQQYSQFNYNTISNYLSKAKIPYENEQVRIERKQVISKIDGPVSYARKIAPVVRRVMMKDADDDQHDLNYWLSKTVQERAAAVTSIISQSLIKGQGMDKTQVVKKIRS